MWLSKPLYEAIPYFYFFAGVSALLASIYLNYWFWPVICLIVGFTCIIGGLVVWLRRRDFRQDRPQPGTEDFD
jgi:hypothetical protein